MTPAELHAAALTRLAGLTTLTVHDSEVPEHPAADSAGRVYPYAVLWPVPGNTPDAARNLEHDPQGGLTWDARVTVASGDPTWTLQALQLVRARIEGWRPAPGSLMWEVDTGGVTVQKDPDTTPARWYAPLQFRTSI